MKANSLQFVQKFTDHFAVMRTCHGNPCTATTGSASRLSLISAESLPSLVLIILIVIQKNSFWRCILCGCIMRFMCFILIYVWVIC